MLLCALIGRPGFGQTPAVYAIKDARIVTVSGPVIPKGTVVFRDGIITAVGENVPIPPEARVIDGSGLTVYPGLFDTQTDLGLPTAPPATGARPGVPAAAPQAQAQAQPPPPPHAQPEWLAARHLQIGGQRFENVRSAGITNALVIPSRGIFIGQSALINTAGDTPQRAVVKSPVAVHIGFTPMGGGLGGRFPGSLMGVFAHIRQTLLDAQQYGQHWELYRRNPRGLQRPEYNESLEALQPVLRGELPVIFHVNSESEIRRAIRLAEEFNVRFILSGAIEAYKAVDVLREKRIPLLVSVNFPERPRDADPEADEPLRILRLRAEAPQNPARLHQAGVKFAFHSGGLSNPRDYLRNVARAIQAGLPEEVALRALTLHAAEILGVAEQLGSIEVGKIANLIITDGDLFAERTRIRHLFIDGREIQLRPSEPERPSASPSASTPPVSVTGAWNLTVESPQGMVPVTADLRQEGDVLSGTVTSPFGQSNISSGSISGREVRFTLSVEIQGTPMLVTFAGRVEGDRMSGMVTVEGMGSFPFSGTRPRG
uniref:Amidohydrolase n=1 Tax=uncultured Acidobacteriota bacterium TaxID=171953 RepID=H5SBT6_9BACT|nr:amidohydrolase [uncultured Acidobacteriota bacterium]